MSLARANLVGLLLVAPVAAVAALPFIVTHGSGSLLRMLRGDVPIVSAAAAVLTGLMVHELLHAAGFLVMGRVPAHTIRFGFDVRALAPYVHTTAPMPARAYRLALVLPVLWLGCLPAIVGALTGSAILACFGVLMCAVATGDLISLWILRRVDGTTLVLDHPSRVGCMASDGRTTGEKPIQRPDVSYDSQGTAHEIRPQ